MTGRNRDRREGSNDATVPLEGGPVRLALAIHGGGVEIEAALTDRQVWTIGRAPDNDVVVAHDSISRHHARLHGGDPFVLEALAATNPLQLGDRVLAPGERVSVAPGQAFALGALVGVIRPIPEARRPRAEGTPAPDEPVPRTAPPAAPARSLREELADEERRRIVEALRRCAGNQSRAAALLGMPRRTLVKRLREYGIPRGRIVPDEG